MRVEPTSIEFIALSILPFTLWKIEIHPITRGLVWLYTLSSYRPNQESTHRQRLVANQFRIQSISILACVPSIGRIQVQLAGSTFACLA